MCFWTLNKKRKNYRRKGDVHLYDKEMNDFSSVSMVEREMIEIAYDLEEKRHRLETTKEMDKAQLTFSRILMAAAILTLGLILLSSFEIPRVNVSPEFITLMISAVIVEIAGIVSIGLMKNLRKEEKEKDKNE